MYTQRITRSQPSFLVLLLDRSTSMISHIEGRDQTKAEFLADAVNQTLANLALVCAREDGIHDYAHVAVLGYGSEVSSAIPGGHERCTISQLGSSPLRVEERRTLVPDGVGGTTERQLQLPVWVEPVADGLTSMVAALERATELVEGWTAEFPTAFPPIVLNVTDGAATDGDPVLAAERLRKVASDDGATLLFNVHVSDLGGDPVTFPRDAAELAHLDDGWAQMLFQMSSPLPDLLVELGGARGMDVRAGSRGMTYLASASELVSFLQLGTMTVTR